MQIRLFGQCSFGILNHHSQFGILSHGIFPFSDWLEDQVSALWDAGVCNKAKKPKRKFHKSAGSAFCNEADDMYAYRLLLNSHIKTSISNMQLTLRAYAKISAMLELHF